MKQILIVFISTFIITSIYAQETLDCEQYSVFNKSSRPDLGIVIYSNDAETVWNALRLATYSQSQGDSVVIFLLAKGLDGFQTKNPDFDLDRMKDVFFENGGQTIACGTCAKQRKTDEIGMCTIASMADLYAIIKKSKKTITF